MQQFGIPYCVGPASPEREFDLFVPEGLASPPPMILFIHGGGWISGDRTMYASEVEFWNQEGFACACIGYRLAPLHQFPTQIADVQDAVISLRTLAEGRWDASKLVAFGNSAGGHLAAMLATCPTYFGAGEPTEKFQSDASVCICPITDIRKPTETQYPIGWSFLEQFVGSLSDERANELASPSYHASADSAPCCILYGTNDDVVPPSQSEAFAMRLEELGVPSQCFPLEHEYHSFSLQGWLRIRDYAHRFISDHLGAPTWIEPERSSR